MDQGELRSRPMGPREQIVNYLGRLLGDNRDATALAEKLTSGVEMATPLGNALAAYDLPGQVKELAQNPTAQTGAAAALTALSVLPFGNQLAKAAGLAAKDAGRTAHIFAGVQAKKANLASRDEAIKLLERQFPESLVWQDTGWNPNISDQAMWEINDKPAKWLPPQLKPAAAMGSTNLKLTDVLDHPELYANYPGLQNVEVRVSQHPASQLRYHAQWSRDGGDAGRITLARDVAENPEQARSVILHELQHAVQDVEGFPRGGSPRYLEQLYADQHPEIRANAHDINTDSPIAIANEQYNRLAGEVEARNVQKRANMDDLQRRVIPPQRTEDRSRDKQIIFDAYYQPVSRQLFQDPYGRPIVSK